MITRCDLYQNPYQTQCRGSISPDGEVSVCWKHLAASRDEWMERALRAERVADGEVYRNWAEAY